MAVTKRTRFEVLRRDDHTCQYCGAKAPDVTLQIDHVVPVALGGDDKPSNLVTACRDCNGGKSSIPPDSPLVQSLSAQAAAYALGMTDKMTRFRADLESLDDYAQEFHQRWDGWTIQGEPLELPADYRSSLYRWMQMGIPSSIFDLAVPSANAKFNRERYMKREDVFSYMAGIVWGMVNQREIDYTVTEETAAVHTGGEFRRWGELRHESGEWRGRFDTSAAFYDLDFVRQHIDQQKLEPRPHREELAETLRLIPFTKAIRRQEADDAA